MIEWIVRQLMRWDSLRSELLAELRMYDDLGRIMKDPESMEVASAYWAESDGWRGWSYNKDLNKYFFNDYPETTMYNVMNALDDMEGAIRL